VSTAAKLALEHARSFIAEIAEPVQGYGFFPGGDTDPRSFSPDGESCTAEEIAAHRAACEAWDRGERPTVPASGRIEGNSLVCGSRFGVGVYQIDNPEAEYVLGLIDEALAEMGGAP